jgi:5'-deoxynucleotidase YfbR-like HD superfamily hydrolase
MSKIFLSYSRKDMEAVKKLARDIQDAGIDVWVDFLEIEVGELIPKRIQEGLTESDHIGIWITRNSMGSSWVEQEWLTKFHAEMGERKVVVLPLLAEEVELPAFLLHKRFADFTSSYKSGLAQLLKALKSNAPVHEATITAYVRDFLSDLSDSIIPLPLHKGINILLTLKKLPRSGKKIRLERYAPTVPVRSVYDHVLSLAHSGDCLFPFVCHGIQQQERAELARCIAYHDLPEVLLGDIPAYTNLTDAKRKQAQIIAERRLSELPRGEPKKIASQFIRMFLKERERKSLDAVNEILADPKSAVHRFVEVLDKVDPIVAVWRYLHQFRGTLDPDAKLFLGRMKDFFDNPRIKEIAKNYKEDPLIEKLVWTLQDRQLARRYYEDGSLPASAAGLERETFRQLIEGTDLTFV